MSRGGFRRAKRERPEADEVESAESAPVASEEKKVEEVKVEQDPPKTFTKRYILQKATIISGKVRHAGEEIRREQIADFDERVRAGRIKAVED